MSESRTFEMREGSGREYEEERVDSTVKEGRFQGGEGERARRAFLGEVEESMSYLSGRKSFPGGSAES